MLAFRTTLLSVVPFVLAGSARAQCPSWMPGFGLPGTGGVVHAIAATGDDVYAASELSSAGGVPTSWVARWNGSAWQSLDGGINGPVYALAIFDDGSGAAVYAGGGFTTAGTAGTQGIAKWNGASWDPLAGGTDGSVRALTVFDDGGGPALYAGGLFSQAGGSPAANVASWNGASWSALGSGMDDEVRSFELFDDGSGRKVYAGGLFFQAGGSAAAHVARWDGATWSPLACGIDGEVRTLLAFDAGGGTQLYAGGNFNVACGVNAQRLARWDGNAWTTLPGGSVGNHVNALAKHYDATQGRFALLAGGLFTHLGNPSVYTGSIASWDGSTWSPIGGVGLNGFVHALRVFTPIAASAPLLYVGGTWNGGFSSQTMLRAWDGNDWVGEWSGGSGILTSRVNALCEHDDGSGRALFVAGIFDKAIGGATTARNIVRFDGQDFSPLGPTGTGPVGLAGEVFVLAEFDSGQGPELYAGGKSPAYNRIAKWNGTSWSDVGGGVVGFYGNSDGDVRALQVFDDGSGPALYVGGNFTTTGAGPIAGVARWDGANWSQLGGGLEGSGPSLSVIDSMTVFDDGTGAALYVGGSFRFAGNPAVVELAKWDGSAWTAISGNPLGPIYALQPFDDNSGGGPVLEVGGYYGFARWDGASWSSPGGGANQEVNAFTVWDQGGDGTLDLAVGGDFTLIGGTQSSSIAIRRSCGGPAMPFCAGDGTLSTPCPCGNSGLSGRGCENSSSTGGSRLEASGTVSPDTVVLSASYERPTALSIFLQGDVSIAGGTSFGDGLRCVGGTLKRIASAVAVGGVVSYPHPTEPSITQQSASLGDPISPGSTRYYQVYYRDPDPVFCPTPPGGSFNISNGLRVIW